MSNSDRLNDMAKVIDAVRSYGPNARWSANVKNLAGKIFGSFDNKYTYRVYRAVELAEAMGKLQSNGHKPVCYTIPPTELEAATSELNAAHRNIGYKLSAIEQLNKELTAAKERLAAAETRAKELGEVVEVVEETALGGKHTSFKIEPAALKLVDKKKSKG